MSSNHRRSRSLSPLEERRRPKHQRNEPDCRLCRKDHPLRTCHKFRNMNIIKRLQAVKLHRYCINCLAHSHLLSKCRSRDRCHKCGGQHHTFLHKHKRLRSTKHIRHNVTQSTTILSSIILRPTVIIRVCLGNDWGNIRGLLNPSIERSEIAEFLTTRYHLHVEQSGQERLCKIKFKPYFDDDLTYSVTARVTTTLPYSLRTQDLDKTIADNYKNLRLADPKFYKSCEINIFLGADIYPQLIKPVINSPTLTTPMAQDTVLGWTLIGKIGI